MKKIFFLLLVFTSVSNFSNAQWQLCGLVPSTTRMAIKDTNIFVVTAGIGISLSTNNGNTWSTLSGISNRGIENVVVNGTKLFAGSGNRGVFLSFDNGASWVQTNNGLTDTNITCLAICGNNIFAGTFSHGIFVSSNNGATWSAVNNGLTNPYIKSIAVSGSNIYAGTSYFNGGVFLSSNNGVNWTLLNNGLQQEDVLELAIKDTNIFVAYPTHGIYLSSNNGVNWSQINNGLTDTNIQALKVCGSNIFTATVFDNVFISTNNGANWISFSDNWVGGHDINDFAINQVYIFAADAGGVWRRRISEIPSCIKEELVNSNLIVYPNPTMDNFTIDVSASLNIPATIEISNIQGQLLNTLTATSGQMNVDISSLPSGLYMVEMKTEKGVVVKKFVKE